MALFVFQHATLSIVLEYTLRLWVCNCNQLMLQQQYLQQQLLLKDEAFRFVYSNKVVLRTVINILYIISVLCM